MTPQSGKADVLLPCPFCGPGQSQIDLWFDDVSQRWRVGCGRCGCSTGTSPRDKTQAPAIAAWNRRPAAPSGDVLTEPALSDNTVRQALEEAHKAVKLLEDLTACGSDDDYVSGVQSKITAALTALSAPIQDG